ncbi:MAG: D-glycero-beta-D-manno-heptose-7-phosphate kinase [Pseudomonadota bacterium]|nr:D-glycero-beta-D-manno-heptose-7-phosphate kinase [Pseudomonadota bacterium]
MFDRLARGRVLVAGDVMMDRYWFGGVDRISPEAPVPVVAVGRRENRVGGAANVARNVAVLGARCALLSVVGDDEAGRELREIVDASGIDSRLQIDADAVTTIKLRIISRNQQLLRADFETEPAGEVLSRCLDDYRGKLHECDVVVLSDYGKGGLRHVEQMIDLARKAGIPVLVDPKGSDFSRYRGASMITPNLKEFEAVAGGIEGDDDMERKARAMIEGLNLEKLLVTLSDKGMVLYQRDKKPLLQVARVKEVYDVSGAGDTVIAMLALAWAGGLDDEQALTLANSAASAVVSKLGTAVPTRQELSHSLGGVQ